MQRDVEILFPSTAGLQPLRLKDNFAGKKLLFIEGPNISVQLEVHSFAFFNEEVHYLTYPID